MASGRNSIPPATLQHIKDRIDLLDLVSRYVTLSKTGQNYKGLCPFHAEKTPSFSVSPSRGMFHCFGCGEGGDAFTFLMKREGLTFPEAVAELARQTGVILREPTGTRDSALPSERERYDHLQALAASWFQGNLRHADSGKEARQYLRDRGIGEEIIQEFGLGYALPGWEGLSRYLESQGCGQDEALRSGLVVPRESGSRDVSVRSGYYDRFRNRIMFPIMTLRDRVVAFGGRTLGNSEGAKYMNSPETPFFSKGRQLYGLEKARSAASRSNQVVVVEGYFDVLALHQAGIRNAVAPLGTAFTADHLQVLRRMVKTITFLFDGDDAGKTAVYRALDLFFETGITAKVMVLPADEDPDTFIRTRGIEGFRELEAQALSLFEFAIELCLERGKVETVEDRVRAVDTVLRIVQRVQNPVEKSEYFQLVSDRLGIRHQVLMERYPSVSTVERRTQIRRKEQWRDRATTDSSIPKGFPEERDLVTLLLKGALDAPTIRQLKDLPFKDPSYRNILERAFTHLDDDRGFDQPGFQADLLQDESCAPLVTQLTLLEREYDDISGHIQGCLAGLRRKYLEHALNDLIAKLRVAEREKRHEEVQTLIIEIDRLRGEKAMLAVP